MLDLNDVALFVKVAESGSFAGAARRVGLPPNTLSRRVQHLEDTLNVRLLHRSTRKLTLTDAGKRLYEHSADKINGLHEVSRLLVGANQEPMGNIRVAAPADFFEIYLMEWIADFLSLYPGLYIDFVLSDTLSDMIAEGIDVAFRGGVLKDSSLVARKISTGRRILAASQAFLDQHGIPADIHELGNFQCIRASNQSDQTVWHLTGEEGEFEIEVGGRFCANTAQAQLKAALYGLGICLLPESLLQESLKNGRLVPVLPMYGQPNNDMSIVYPSRRHIPLAVSVFVEHTATRFKSKIIHAPVVLQRGRPS
ncbi:LysR family transcriptional regulator [Rahnella sp. PCH160]|uniref:LysR family transcriptional regulator n=1 Tax=Rahnella sp. PCH160 TaxID=3447928 RepID=UPI0039FD9BC3